MPDLLLFMFGLLATFMAIGPLVIAMLADIREDTDDHNSG